MTAPFATVQANGVLGEPAPPIMHRAGIDLPALSALFWLSVRQHCRARRLFVILFLFLLPSVIALIVRYTEPTANLSELEIGLVFFFIPHALVPLTALLYSSGMIQDEMEDQTLTYLLIRPLPRWTIYVAKLLATLLVTCALVAVFTMLTEIAVYAGTPELASQGILLRSLQTAALYALALMGYCSIFGCLSLFARRSLVLGVAYIIVFEGIISNIPFVVRQLTVMYYLRVLVARWLRINPEDWVINLKEEPGATACVLTLTIASLVAVVAASLWFTHREFRVKTPEGS